MLSEFLSFLKNYGVVGLAIAVIRKLSAGGILYGKVLGASLDFLVVAVLVFVFAKLVLKEETVAKR